MVVMSKNNNHTPTKKEQKLTIFIIIITIIILGGLTYTYFAVSVSNANNEKIQTQTATMSLVFDDNDNGINASLNLGESIVKKFTLENTGTVDAYGKINWVDLVNTYTSDSLTWTLEQSTTENGTYTSIGSGNVPTSSTATTYVLKNGLSVPVGTTYYYKLTITLNNLDIDQSSDINAHMNSKFSLEARKKLGTDTILDLVAGEPSDTVDVITKEAPSGASCTNTLAYDGTVDNNLRFVGRNPCNYVTFNGETAGWRIVGIMNNVDDGTGNKETRIKLLRKDTLGLYSWDTSTSGVNGATSNYGINDWTQADLKNELNGDYLNTNLNANTMWYNGSSDQQSATFDYTKRLSTGAQESIGNTKWHLGGLYSSGGLLSHLMYNGERGTTTWSTAHTCNDEYCPRATEWTGKVALIYPSDYGYATAGGPTRSRYDCIHTISLYRSNANTWNNNANKNCKDNDWINQQMALTPTVESSSNVFVAGAGVVGDGHPSSAFYIYPAVYLKSSVKISGGNGSPENPYVIQ